MEGLTFFVLLVLVVIYVTIIQFKKKIILLIKTNQSETSRKLKILVDNQLELHDILVELKENQMFEDDATIEDIDNIITDIEFEKAKEELLKNGSKNLDEIKAKLSKIENINSIVPNSDELNEEELAEMKSILEEDNKIQEEFVLGGEENFDVDEEDVEVQETIEMPKKETQKQIVFEKPEKLSFKERFPDLEKFIGENLINKIGIVITVIGIIFSVKYAIDNDYINEYGRVLIGIGAGGLLIGVAHKLRLNYNAFSSVLVGGGLATLYFTIGLAFQDYQIFTQAVAFALMLVITIFAVLLSILYNKQELAVLAIIGGFATPLSVSTGGGNYVVLFSYLLLLNTGMLALAYFKNWRLVNIISYFFTIIMFAAWMGDSVSKNKLPLQGAFLFATLFYFMFFFQNVIYNLKAGTKFKAWEFFILLSNSFAYFGAGLYILHNQAPEFKGLFTALVSVFNFVFAFSLYKKSDIDKNLVFLLIGLVLSFISLIGPIQLHGNYITLFWAAEAVILLWMWQKTQIELIKLASVLVLAVMFISLFMDWEKIYLEAYYSKISMKILLNKGFLTGLTSLVSLSLTYFFLTKEKNEYFYEKINLKVSHYSSGVLVALLGVLYLVFFLEISYHLRVYFENTSIMNTYLSSYNILFLLGLGFWLNRQKTELTSQISLVSGFLALLIYASYILPVFADYRNLYLSDATVSATPMLFHFLTLAMVMAIVAINLLNFTKYDSENMMYRLNQWLSVFYVLGVLSAEIDNVVLFNYFDASKLVPLEGYDEVQSWQFSELKDSILVQSHKIAFPVLWGVSSFVLMVFGLRKDIRELRIIALVVFFITVVKLFLIDVWDMQAGGRILSFVVLGVLLLIVSFMYQKLKLLVVEKDEAVEEPKSEIFD